MRGSGLMIITQRGSSPRRDFRRQLRLGAARLVLLALLVLALALGGLGGHLLVVLLKRGQVLAGLGELALLHALADVPVHEGALGVHEVELVVDARERLG